MTRRQRKVAAWPIAAACLAALALACWGLARGARTAPEAAPFTWNRDELFRALEHQFAQARQTPLHRVRPEFDVLVRDGRRTLAAIASDRSRVPFQRLQALETIQFRLAAFAAAHATLLADAQAFIAEARRGVARAARHWPVTHPDVHEALYRVVYGGRSAIEEALAQQRSSPLPALTRLEDVPSATPSALVGGVRVHSGDIILSRGGAPTSALIARGNIYPANFSHVAIVHVDPQTTAPTVIESLIEHGAVTTTAEAYLNAKSLRLLLLRLRPEHPVLQHDALAPHKAAAHILDRVRRHHVRYDFSMNWKDPSRMFCSEIVYHAYRAVDIDLWAYKSRLSSPGLVRWLGDMGATYFTTLVPSDLEYEPWLVPVAEWRNLDALRHDRLDNVTLDTLLEGAERGDHLGYAWYMYPAAQATKAWSVIRSSLGSTPSIPEGMSVDTALRANSLVNVVHPRLRAMIEDADRRYTDTHGHAPPYWSLMALARAALASHRRDLSPWLVTQPSDP